MKKFLLAFASYPLISFPLAIVWHLVVFKDIYDELGYISREEPIIAFGLLAMLVQAVVLAYLYPLFYRSGNPATEGLRYGMAMGAFLWASHVAAAAAKHEIAPLTTFFAIETLYLAIQFSLVGVAIGMIYGRTRQRSGSPA